MIEKVNPQHPDKIADRIAGALVDLCYKKSDHPKCAFEVLIGHKRAYIIAETSEHLTPDEVNEVVERIAGDFTIEYIEAKQDVHLEDNQLGKTRAGDNGIFKGVPISFEVAYLSKMAREIYKEFPSDGKYIVSFDDERIIACQSNANYAQIKQIIQPGDMTLVVNPLGDWTGGTDVDTGATNRKLGSDMGEAVTGGGLHGKDLSKADVSVNIYAHIIAQKTGKIVEYSCAIGDEEIDGLPYSSIVSIARDYINKLGGFEKLAEWGLV